MKLITELYDDVNQICEAKGDGSKSYVIEGIFAQSEKANRNKRIYRKSIIQPEIERYIKEYVETKRALGEMEHPTTPKVNLDRVSHLITELRMDGNDVYGRATILDTPCGKIAKAFIDEGVRLGVSTRAVGSLKTLREGISEVQNDFKLSTIDIVHEPSGIDCWVNGIMEGVEWVFVDGKWEQKSIEESVQNILNAPQKRLNEVKFQEFSKFINSL